MMGTQQVEIARASDGKGAAVDDSGTLVSQSYDHWKVHEGQLFEAHFEDLDLDIIGPLEVLISVGAKDLHLFYSLSAIGGRVQFQLFEGATITVKTTEVVPNNLNRPVGDATPPAATFWTAFTKTADGTEVLGAKRQLFGATNVIAQVQSTAKQTAERVLSAGVDYLLRMTSAADNCSATIDTEAYEVAP